MKKIILSLMTFFCMIPITKAICSDDEIIRLSKIANNVMLNYEYNEKTNKFDITFSNLTTELVVKDVLNDKLYNKDIELKINGLNSGYYKFDIISNDTNCYNDIFVTKYISLPYYNKYYNTEDCKGITEFSYCSKWVKNEIEYDIFKKKTQEYRENLKTEEIKEIKEDSIVEKIKKIIVKIYVQYYYIILPLIITILCVIIYLKDKSEQLI